LHQAVVEGSTAADLQLGPGLVAGTSIPGDPGNAIIAGRRVSFGGPFGGIGGLKPGDQIDVTDGAGKFVFSVTSITSVSQTAVTAPSYSPSWLTLVTSNSSWVPSGKLVVMARITSRPATGDRKALHGGSSQTHYALPSFAGDAASGGLALLWSLALVGILGLMVLSIRRWRQPWVSWLLAAPILLACALFACESLARCLPSTL
jgi:sortase A